MKQLMVVLAILIAVGLSACSSEGPQVTRAKAVVKKLNDVRKARDIIDSGVARGVNCALAARHAFSRETGNAQVWTYRQSPDSALECFDTEGYHPTGRSMLREITKFEVEEILGNPDCYPPPRPSRPAPTPFPDISDGRCCPR